MFKDIIVSSLIALFVQFIEILIKIVVDDRVFFSVSVVPALDVGIDLILISITVLLGGAYARRNMRPTVTPHMFFSLSVSCTALFICMALVIIARFSLYPFGDIDPKLMMAIPNVLGLYCLGSSVYAVR